MKAEQLAKHSSDRIKGLAAAFATCLLWGVLALILKYLSLSVSVSMIVWFRFAVAAGVQSLLIVYLFRNNYKTLTLPPWTILLAGSALALNYFAFMRGVQMTTAITAQILIQSGPLLLAVSGFIFFRERIRREQWLGLGIALIGFMLFYFSKAGLFSNDSMVFNRGSLWILLGAITWAIYSVLVKTLSRRSSLLLLNLIVYMTSAFLLLPWVDFNELWHISPLDLLILTLLGFNTVFAYGFLAYALAKIPAYQISMIIAVNPLITIALTQIAPLIGWNWILADPLGVSGILGAALVVAGIVATIRPPSRPKVQKTRL